MIIANTNEIQTGLFVYFNSSERKPCHAELCRKTNTKLE